MILIFYSCFEVRLLQWRIRWRKACIQGDLLEFIRNSISCFYHSTPILNTVFACYSGSATSDKEIAVSFLVFNHNVGFGEQVVWMITRTIRIGNVSFLQLLFIYNVTSTSMKSTHWHHISVMHLLLLHGTRPTMILWVTY